MKYCIRNIDEVLYFYEEKEIDLKMASNISGSGRAIAIAIVLLGK